MVRHNREQQGISRRQLARDAGVSVTTLVELESGKRSVTLATLAKVLWAIGFELHFKKRGR